MWIRNIRRFIAEAFSGIFKNALMTIASLIVVTSCLLMLGVFFLVTLNVNSISEDVADACQVKAYITKEAQEKGKQNEIEEQIRRISYTEEVVYENGVEAFKKIKKDMSKEDRLAFGGLPDDLLNDSFNITVNDISNTEKITKALMKIKGIEKVESGDDIVSFINSLRQTVKNVSFWIILAFMLISIFIISNTVKLTVHNRRREINIMKYVGATDSYIKWPFIIEGIIVGLIAAGIAYIVTSSIYTGLVTSTNKDASVVSFIKMVPFKEMWHIFALSYTGLGAVIGAIGSAMSVRKYLKV